MDRRRARWQAAENPVAKKRHDEKKTAGEHQMAINRVLAA
jgi:hypothetical protein